MFSTSISSPKIEFNQAEAISNFTKSHKGNSLKHVLIISGITAPILIIFIIVFVLSFGQEYKNLKMNAKIYEKDLYKFTTIYETKNSDLAKLEKDHHELFETLRKPKDISILKDENPFIENIVLVTDEHKENVNLIKSIYKVETTSSNSTLQNIYDLMKRSNEYGAKFDIDFPIVIESDRGGERATFNLNIYKLQKIERSLVRPYTEIQK